jgi:hypothetical protein
MWCLTVVARGGIEPPTYRFSGGRSYQLSYLAKFAVLSVLSVLSVLFVPREPGEVYRTSSIGSAAS